MSHAGKINVDSSIQTALSQNEKWMKQSADEPNNLFKALSNAVYLTSRRADSLREILALHFLNNLDTFLRLHDFPTLEAVEHFLLNPQLPQYQRVLFQVAASCFQSQIKVYYIHQDSLCTDYFGPKVKKSLSLIRLYDGHFASVFKARSASLFGFVQNILLNVVEFALSPHKPRKWANINNQLYRNFEFEEWQQSFSVKQGVRPEGSRPGRPPGRVPRHETTQIGNFLLRVMHLRPHSDSLLEMPEDSNDKIAAILDSPLTKYVIRLNLLEFRRRTEEEARRVDYEIEMDYERLLAAEFDRLPSVLSRNNDSDKGGSQEKTDETPENVDDGDDCALFRPFLKRGSSLEALEEVDKTPPSDSPQPLNSRRESEDLPTTEPETVPKSSPNDPQQTQKKTKTKLVFRKAKEFSLPATPQTSDPFSGKAADESQPPRPTTSPIYDLPTYQIQAATDHDLGLSSNSYITPFFGSDEDISHSRVFSNLVSKLSTTKNPSNSEVIDPTLYYGHLKFFDDRNNFGFISTLVNGLPEDIFAYGSEFDERVQFHPMFRNPKLGQHILFQFNICTYFGKYKKSKKAMNIRVVDGIEF